VKFDDTVIAGLTRQHNTSTQLSYEPFNSWTARLLSVAPDNTVRVLWTNAAGKMSFWVMDAQGQSFVTWNHAGDGLVSLWGLQDSSPFTFTDFGPYTDWTAGSLAVGADSTLHVGWTQPSGAVSLWDLSGTAYQFSVYDPDSTWHLQGLTAAP